MNCWKGISGEKRAGDLSMKNRFAAFLSRLAVFMSGRYGVDELSHFMSVVCLIFLVLSFFRPLRFLIFAALAVTLLSSYRIYSKNIGKRHAEREFYLKIRNALTRRFRLAGSEFRDRKTHRYFTCPYCGATMRITNPGKKHTVSIRCAKCGKHFEKRT